MLRFCALYPTLEEGLAAAEALVAVDVAWTPVPVPVPVAVLLAVPVEVPVAVGVPVDVAKVRVTLWAAQSFCA